MLITTQLIGQTSAVKGGLFRIKQRLQFLGFVVEYPVVDQIVRTPEGKSLVYDPKEWSAYEISLSLAESIRDNDVHIVSNDVAGIIGKQAALSICLAMLYGKPVVITHKPFFRPNVPSDVIAIINRNAKQLNFQNLLKLSNTDFKPYVELIAEQKPMYRLSKQEKTYIKRAIRDVLRESLSK